MFQFPNGGAQGTVPAGLASSVVVTFRPQMPGNYYKRLFLCARDQIVSFIDLVGTAHDDETRPQPLMLRHVDAHRRREISGMARLSPERILALAAQGDDPGTREDIAVPEYDSGWTRSGETTRGRVEILRQYFLDSDAPERPIAVRERAVDFGAGAQGDVMKKTVQVTNRADAKVVCAWNVGASRAFAFSPARRRYRRRGDGRV